MTRSIAAAVLLMLLSSSASAQQIDLGIGSSESLTKRQHVELISDAITLTAEKPQDIEVLFRVDPGFHINSHEPKDELQIPTALRFDDVRGFRNLSQQYPKGATFKIVVGNESETLDVYTGEFRIGLRVMAQRGTTKLVGTLRYQACDNAACFPPRDLPVTLRLIAK